MSEGWKRGRKGKKRDAGSGGDERRVVEEDDKKEERTEEEERTEDRVRLGLCPASPAPMRKP